MIVPPDLISAFPPSSNEMFDFVRRRTDDAMLMDVARADYGNQADEMFAHLRLIRDRGVLPDPMPFWLTEVLELTRFCDPDQPEKPPFQPGPTGRRGHQSRLFACVVLFKAAEPDACDWMRGSEDSTLAQCLSSAKALGDETSQVVASYLTWRLSRSGDDENRLLFALGLLILAIRLRRHRFDPTSLGTFGDWFLAEEAEQRFNVPPQFREPPSMSFSLQQGYWRPLKLELDGEIKTIPDGAVREKLQLCALLLQTPWDA